MGSVEKVGMSRDIYDPSSGNDSGIHREQEKEKVF